MVLDETRQPHPSGITVGKMRQERGQELERKMGTFSAPLSHPHTAQDHQQHQMTVSLHIFHVMTALCTRSKVEK